jgi:uncharacterized protein (TIGR03000 family)
MPPSGEPIPRPKKMKTQTSASLLVTLPEDAKLTIDGRATKETSGTRLFITPPLETGWDYQYQLRAEIIRDGQRRALTQKVTIRPGEETRVNLTDFTSAQVVGNPQ